MSLIAHWLLNDAAASTAVADASGNGYNGTAARNTSLFTDTGKVNAALHFNGSSDNVAMGHVAALDIISDLTVAFWIKSDTAAAYMFPAIQWQSGGSYRAWEFIIHYNYLTSSVLNGKLAFRHGNGTTLTAKQTTGTPLGDTNWHHVAAVRVGGDLQNLTLYVDGAAAEIQLAQGNAATTAAAHASSVCTLASAATAGWLDGLLDDFRVYDEALSLNKVLAIYNGGNGSEVGLPWAARRRRFLSAA